MAIAASAPTTTRRGICCHCGARCGILVEVDQRGEPVSVKGDPSHPMSKGFLCTRGQAAIEYLDDPTRLNVPLKRVGERGAGQWQEVSWDEALDDIAARLLAIRDTSGPEAVAYLCGTFHGADANFGYRLMHHFGSPNSGGIGLVCGGPRYQAEALTFGFGPTAAEIVPGRTEVILMWGLQSSASAPWSWGRTREAIRQGSKLIAIDPRPTPESRQADLWLQPRPGTDAALALGFIQVILTEQLWDREFVGQWTNGLEALRARAAEYPPERVEAITGVPADDIRRAARLYARASTAALTSGAPNGMGRNTLNYTRALCILIALTGNLDRSGGNRLLGRNPALGSKTSYEDYAALPPEQRRKRLGADRFKLHDEGYELLSAAARPVWHGIEYPYSVQFWAVAHPPSVFRSILSGRPYQVRALLVQHNNILGCYSNSRVAYDALRSPALELSVVHEISMTPTAMLADYVLPAAGWIEKPFLWSSGRGDAVLSGQQIVGPRHQRRSDYDLCRDLGRRLGQTWPDTVEAVWDEWLRGVGLSFRELAERDQPWLPPDGERARHAALDPATGQPYGFGTPSGKIELASSVLEQLGYDPLPRHDQQLEERLGSPDEYPFALMSGATRQNASHQDHRQIRSLRARHPDPTVEIDPLAAAQYGIAAGDWVRIETPRGSLRQRARLVPGLGTERVNAERWWYPEREAAEPSLFGFWESNVNAYNEDDPDLCDQAYGTWPYRVARCRIARDEVGRDPVPGFD